MLLVEKIKEYYNSNKIIFTWLENGNIKVELKYHHILEKANAIAHHMKENGIKKGDRVVMCFPLGLEFIPVILACLKLNAVMVSVTPPRSMSEISNFKKVLDDSGAKFGICCGKMYYAMKAMYLFKSFKWLNSDSAKKDLGYYFIADVDNMHDVALIQYTSGSTGNPKGVPITYHMIDENMKAISEHSEIDENTVGFNWVPHYHDMGLFGCYLVTLFCGCRTISMSPFEFIKDPTSWYELSKKYNATHICAPNFAYKLLARKCSTVDMSYIKVATLGGDMVEPVTLDIMKNDLKISPEAIVNSYGMAELGAFATCQFNPDVNDGRVNCGSVNKYDMEMKVDREDNVWVKSSRCIKGYQNNKESERFVDGWFKTGDRGFVKDGHLYIEGRSSEMLIINGKNYYPRDIEIEIENSNNVRKGGVVVVQWTDTTIGVLAESEEKLKSLKAPLPIGIVKIVPKNTVPKTTSGKSKRYACKEILQSSKYKSLEIEKGHEIAIIGAGPAGLVAAYSLVKNGYSDIVIYERNAYVGGRSVGFRGYDEIYIAGKAYSFISFLAKEFGIEHNNILNDDPKTKGDYSIFKGKSVDYSIDMEETIRTIWTKAGYGILESGQNEKTGKIHEFFSKLYKNVPSSIDVTETILPKHFFKELWENVCKFLKDNGVEIKLSYDIKDVDDVNSTFKIISKVPYSKCYNYGFVTFEADGLNKSTYELIENHKHMENIGKPLQIYKRGDIWYSLFYKKVDDLCVSEKTVENLLIDTVDRLGGKYNKTLQLKSFDMFPQISSMPIQGENGKLYVGAACSFDLTEVVARHAHSLITEYFPPKDNSEFDVDVESEYIKKTYEEVFPLIPVGETFLFPRYYKFLSNPKLKYKSGRPMKCYSGSVTIEKNMQWFDKGYFDVFIEAVKVPNAYNILDTDSSSVFLKVVVGGKDSFDFVSAPYIFPVSAKFLYESSYGIIHNDNTKTKEMIAFHKRWLEKSYRNMKSFIDGPFYSAGSTRAYRYDDKLITFVLENSEIHTFDLFMCILDSKYEGNVEWNDNIGRLLENSEKVHIGYYDLEEVEYKDHEKDILQYGKNYCTLDKAEKLWGEQMEESTRNMIAITEVEYNESENSLDEKILQFISYILQVKVKRSDSLLEMGATSFQLVGLSNYIKNLTSTDVPIMIFFDMPTVGDVLDYINNNRKEDSTVKCTFYEDGNVVRSPSKKLIWCMPPIIGSGSYRNFSKDLDYTVAELFDMSCYSKVLTIDNLEQVTHRYLSKIKEVQSEGPYTVVGYSFGTLIAHSLTKYIDVDYLILIDGISPANNYISSLSVNYGNLVDKESRDGKMIAQQLKIGKTYKPNTWGGQLILFRESQNFFAEALKDKSNIVKDTLGWCDLEDNIKTIKIPDSNHLNIVHEPYVDDIVKSVNELDPLLTYKVLGSDKKKTICFIGGFPDNERLWENQFYAFPDYKCVFVTIKDFEMSLAEIQERFKNTMDIFGGCYAIVAHDLGVLWSSQYKKTNLRINVEIGDMKNQDAKREKYFKLLSESYDDGVITSDTYDFIEELNFKSSFSTRLPRASDCRPYKDLLVSNDLKLPKPTLCIVGEEVNVKFYSQKFKTELGENFIRMQTGHWPMREKPNEFNRYIIKILE